MSAPDQGYADEYWLLVVKSVSKCKRTFQFNLQIQKEYIIFYLIWFILCILEQVIQMAHKQIVPTCPPTPTLYSDIELVVYNLPIQCRFMNKLNDGILKFVKFWQEVFSWYLTICIVTNFEMLTLLEYGIETPVELTHFHRFACNYWA